MADPNRSISISTLTCKEDLDDETDHCDTERGMLLLYSDSSIFESDEEYVEMMLNKELVLEKKACNLAVEDALRPIRSDAIRWILKTKALFNFSVKTAFMAVVYFDQFFMHRSVDIVQGKVWAVKLLSIACLSLAAKMEEYRVPALPEFRVEGYQFNSRSMQRMELLVLSTLDWKMTAVTPFSYLSYFASRFAEVRLEDLVYRATAIIFAAIEAIDLADYQPSVVAGAAVLASLDKGLNQELMGSKMSKISSFGSLDVEHVFSCYNLMVQESLKQGHRPAKELASASHSTPNCASVNISVDASGTTTSFASTMSKRRRLQ